ncbi:hypothetical protein HF086_008630 [Spodoptera exigua]|uniref:PHD-type domain-containing protein n=1 Tax=Spodoptera exigua TaxID=7107 RepID=A0A922M2D7_SPOEX|nr:hypothetical protein HF086_008630 [Spodoptera exigua]
MAKCGGCGQFIAAATASIRCSKCAGCYHRACVGVPATATPPPAWLCPGCKAKMPRSDNSATPVKAIAEDSSVSVSPPTIIPGSLDLALEIRSFREELSALRVEIRELRQETSDFRAALKGCNDRMSEVESRVTDLEQRFEAKGPSSYDHLEQTIADLKVQLNERDQDLLLNDVIMSGIPEAGAENPTHLIKAVSLKLGIALDDRDIVHVERLGMVRRNFVAGSSEGDLAERPRPRAIAVRLSRRTVRDQLIRAARVRRGLTTTDLELPGRPQKIFVNENLTRSNARLFHIAREMGQRLHFRYVWTKEGRIYVRKEDGVSAQRVRSEVDLKKIFGDVIV